MKNAKKKAKKTLPAQHQNRQPGFNKKMHPKPEYYDKAYKGSGKLAGKVAIITGGDSGIGRSIAIYYAVEKANIVIVYLDEHEDAKTTKKEVEKRGRKCLTIAGDIGNPDFCKNIIKQTLKKFGKIDILVNNAGEQHVQEDFKNISKEQLERTFKTNLFSMFYLTQAALPHLKKGSSVINTASITAYKGKEELIDYSSTKGAIVSFTRSLSQSVIKKGIRVNAVAPGPIWTPLIPASFSADYVSKFGSNAPMGRPGQPKEVAPCYVFLASEDASYMAGQVLHPNGGTIVNG